MTFRSCDTCGKFFNGILPYNSHLVSEKHKKNVGQENASAMAVDAPRITLGPSCNTSDSTIKSLGSGFYCTLCKLDINSLNQLKSHVMGSKHLKMKKRHLPKDIMAENPEGDMANLKLSDFREESYKGIQAILQDDFKFKFHDICIENVLENVKIFGVNDPIVF